jgi:hypothetical protein
MYLGGRNSDGKVVAVSETTGGGTGLGSGAIVVFPIGQSPRPSCLQGTVALDQIPRPEC